MNLGVGETVSPTRKSHTATLRRELAQQRVARFLAGSTRFGADAAVLHAVLRVPLALVTAEPAGGCAGTERGSGELGIKRCLAGNDASGRVTDIGAIEIEPDAADQIFDGLFAKAGVSARRACLCAVEASANAGQQLVIAHDWLGM